MKRILFFYELMLRNISAIPLLGGVGGWREDAGKVITHPLPLLGGESRRRCVT